MVSVAVSGLVSVQGALVGAEEFAGALPDPTLVPHTGQDFVSGGNSSAHIVQAAMGCPFCHRIFVGFVLLVKRDGRLQVWSKSHQSPAQSLSPRL